MISPLKFGLSGRWLPLCLLTCLAWSSQARAQTVLVKPYVQPGDGSTLTGADVKTILWVTDETPGEFVVEYGPKQGPMTTAKITHLALDFAPPTPGATTKPAGLEPEEVPKPFAVDPDPDKAHSPAAEAHAAATQPTTREAPQHYIRYAASLVNLPFDASIVYRVRQGSKVIRESAFRTRASRGKPIRFVMVGDLADGKSFQNEVAYQISRTDPDFMVLLGDIVYPLGRVSQYMDHFWRTYDNVNVASPTTGAPLMASVPFYPVLGNHDLAARLAQYPDALGAFYFFDVPNNGPGEGAWTPSLGPDKAAAAAFRARAGKAYPSLGFYSFDDGPAHFLVLDASNYVPIGAPVLREWIERDLKESKAPWKFVCFHSPGFQTSQQHYTEQKMRLLEPVFEQCGVDVIFAGHVHNYQRSKPFLFAPTDPLKREPRGTVSGKFTLDEKFDGIRNTHPNGVIHIICGGGGAHLYATDAKTIAAVKKQYAPSYDEFIAKYFSAAHCFTTIDLTPQRFHLRAITLHGEVIDEISIDKKN